MNHWTYFSTSVFDFKLEEYIDSTLNTTNEYLNEIKKNINLDLIYPNYQTDNFFNDSNFNVLSTEIIKRCNASLEEQGYDTSNYELFFTEMWAQEHYKTSGQERHIHGNNLLSGFYFLQCPENGCKLLIHEPRSAKEFGNFLPEKNKSAATQASSIINFSPEPGQLLIINSYTPHSFSRNESDTSSIFIHFNIGARYKEASVV